MMSTRGRPKELSGNVERQIRRLLARVEAGEDARDKNLTMTSIAAMAGISRASLYRYFGKEIAKIKAARKTVL